ncbi:molybdopterin cofactor-binding domain-containing protein [Marinibacterium profundimaris]|uniref:molybdopterin cofactor-binding domain-containing protein n=1 Tax=Marinibacterium profundimaris TaxID=1679460 RepID=UPI001303DF0C|nr:molybdopterin cofactor-binding domain-containing protein [Marinibacterium profundimaris]
MTRPAITIWRHGQAGTPEPLLDIAADGRVTGYTGHVDLGTGLRTAMAQIVAEELDIAPGQVSMVMGDTASTPDQGPTIASESIQIAAVPLRQAAAQARAVIAGLASARLNAGIDDLDLRDGMIGTDAARLPIADLLTGPPVSLQLDPDTAVKPASDYHLVGRHLPRVDLAGKATGAWTYVHDVAVPGMLHGHVIRPPYAGRDSGPFIGRSLIEVDEDAVSGMAGFVALVRKGDFLGVVAEREGQARAIAEALPVRWATPPDLPDLSDIPGTLRDLPSEKRMLADRGDVDGALERAATTLTRSYAWPWNLHGSIGPSCAVADWREGRVTIWSGTQNPHMLRADIARLMDLPETAVDIVRHEAAGCFGRNCADDVCGDAALLSRATGRPVRVQLTREQEHLWEPKGAAQLMDVTGGLDANGNFDVYDFETRYPSNRGPNLALLLTGAIDPAPQPCDMGDRTAIPPYRIPNLRAAVHDMAPIVRASWFRGVSAMPNTFAHECFIDELAAEAGEDPVAYRLRHVDDPRTADLIRRTAEDGGWQPGRAPRLTRQGQIATGQGFAHATYVHGAFPGVAAAQAAWMAEVTVNRDTGEVILDRITVAQDHGLAINPEGVRHQIHGNVVQSISRAMGEDTRFDRTGARDAEWGSYPIARFEDLPEIRAILMERPEEPPLGVGESASVPSAAAIANAIFDATGVRMRELPFTPERVKAALDGQPLPRGLPAPADTAPPRWRRLATGVGAALAGGLMASAVGLAIRAEIPRVPRPDNIWSAETVERGRQLFAAGACAVCHTAEGGVPLVGGRPMETPFGTVYSTNLTPDPDTGLGAWSYPAFARAMREGVSRDGSHLYPAFPYTAFAKMTDSDLQALYAYIQSLDPVQADTPPASMIAPVNLRPSMAAWNALYHDATPFTPDRAQSELWNRGAYLVEGVGHCAACHSPRNALGAERGGAAHLSGGMVDGWLAPALNGTGPAPLDWTEADFLAYLRDGVSPRHGAAGGPMAPVVAELAALPETDLRAMAHYLASLNDTGKDRSDAAAPLDALALDQPLEMATGPAARLFRASCGACHITGPVPSATAARVPLALSSAVHADRPDSVIRAVIDGLPAVGRPDPRAMPGFGSALTDDHIAALARFLRQTLAPDKPAWDGITEAIGRARQP